MFNVFLENYSDTSSLAIASINLLQFEKRLKNNPFVRQAEVSSDMNGNIFVNIVQKQPLLRIINNNGVSYYLDEKGNKMPVSGNFTARVPVVTGAVESGIDKQTDSLLLKQLFETITFIRNDDFLWSLSEQLHINSKGDTELVPKLGNFIFLLGDLENLKAKFQRLKIFYNEVITNDEVNQCLLINLKFDNQIICTLKNQNL